MVNVEGGASVGGRFISEAEVPPTELLVAVLPALGTPTENILRVSFNPFTMSITRVPEY